jgi:beta-phosphoglucomutase-like phosphatase (HAD superfamily)
MSIRAILFDLDGVLVSLKDMHYETLNKALTDFWPAGVISREDHLRIFDGLPTSKKLQMLTQGKGLPVKLHDLINERKQKYTAEAIRSQDFGVRHNALFARLTREGFILAVCSNAIRPTVEGILSNLMLGRYFDYSQVFCNDCVVNGKPSPDIYLHAMNELEVAPHETIILEDSAHGLEAALASGAFVKKIIVPEDLYNFNFSNK